MKKLWAVLTPQTLLLLILLLIGSYILLSGGGRQENALEERISNALSTIYGMGEVRVVIATRTVQEQSSMGLVQGALREIPCGAVAVVRGEANPLKRAEIMDALCRLLSLPASAVSVISGGD